RSKRDWSSDVCSSDLGAVGTAVLDVSPTRLGVREDRRIDPNDTGDLLTQRQHLLMLLDGDDPVLGPGVADPGLLVHVLVRLEHQIGRASCRERVTGSG